MFRRVIPFPKFPPSFQELGFMKTQNLEEVVTRGEEQSSESDTGFRFFFHVDIIMFVFDVR